MHDDRGMTDAKPSAPSITAQNISYLDDEINRLAAGIEALSFELKPVLTEDSPEKASESPGYSGNTELNEAIASQCRRLNTLNEILRALTARIDL